MNTAPPAECTIIVNVLQHTRTGTHMVNATVYMTLFAMAIDYLARSLC